ncbi:MAG: HEPN domain-containing protein [Synechococcaceae cyanobacterium]
MQAARHEWACFAAHQAVEKALKGLNLALGGTAVAGLAAGAARRLVAWDSRLTDQRRRQCAAAPAVATGQASRRLAAPAFRRSAGSRACRPQSSPRSALTCSHGTVSSSGAGPWPGGRWFRRRPPPDAQPGRDPAPRPPAGRGG